MAGSMNGALLALGVAGAVALAGRVRRGSFAHGWHGRARELLNAAADKEYVDSGDLIEVLEAIMADRSVTGRPRARVVSLLLGSQDEGYLDSGEALEAIEMALGHGSRAVYGMSPDAAGRTLRLGFGKPRSNAGEALNDYRWHPQRAMSQYMASAGKKGKGKGSSAKRVQGTVGGGLMFMPPLTPGGPPRLGVATGRYVAVVAGEHVALPGSVSGDYDLARQYARKTYGTDHVERHGGSRAFLIDDPEYTHYVVHVPSMKIASGWSYAEDAKEALDELGRDKSKFKVYTRKFLREHGHDPRSNGSWF